MGVNLDKMRQAYEDAQKGDLWTPDEGETLLYVHPPCRDDDKHEPTEGLCYVPVVIHYSVGRDNAAVMCLDRKENTLLDHPVIVEMLKKRGVQLGEKLECPVDKAIFKGQIAGDDAKDSRAQERWLWGVTPISFSRKFGGTHTKLPPEPTPYMCGWKVFSAIMAAFSECGDITDPDSAVLFKLQRKGTGLMTKYDGCGADLATVKSPMRLDKATRRLVREAMQPEGDCDLFAIAASFAKSEAEAQAAVTGIRVVTDEPDEPEPKADGDATSKGCFGKDCVDDDECRACEDKAKCAAECKVPVPGGGEVPSKPAEPEAKAADKDAADDEETAKIRAELDALEKKLAATAGGKKGKK